MGDTCTGCGERNPANSEFCLFCGDYLGWDQAASAQGAAGQAPHPATAPTSPAATTGGPPPAAAAAPASPVGADAGATVSAQPARPATPEPLPAQGHPSTVSAGATGATDQIRMAPTASQPPVAAPSPAPEPTTAAAGPGHARQQQPANPSEIVCASCGTANMRERRLCARCGTPLHELVPMGAPRGSAPPTSWWRRFTARFNDPQEAAARRAYRRSLTGAVRWRRWLIMALLLLGLGGGMTALVRGNPIPLARNLWQNLRGDVVLVDGVKAATVPAATDPAAVDAAIDGSPATAWTTAWTPATGTPSCGDPHGTTVLQLSFPAARVTEVHLVTGVTDPSRRALEQLPKAFYVLDDTGQCFPLQAAADGGEQVFKLNNDHKVTQLTLGVLTTYPATDQRAQQAISLSEVSVWARP